MCSGVRKSGWPMPRLMMSRPADCSSVARARTANAFSSPIRSKPAIVWNTRQSSRGLSLICRLLLAHKLGGIKPFDQSPGEKRLMASVAEKRRAFRALHASGCFVLPNPFDIGSARYLQHLGFPALATTSAGLAWSFGRPDGAVSRAAVIDHIRAMVEATDVPINADFESGYADDPDGVAESVRL